MMIFCGQIIETQLFRAKTQDLADNRRMFELFTKCKDHSMHKGDHELEVENARLNDVQQQLLDLLQQAGVNPYQWL